MRVSSTGELASATEDLITTLFGAWLIAGAATDSWAHNNILADVQADGFFTPWHGLLYTGFAATAGWTFFLAYRRRNRASRWWLDGWPRGYRLGALGAVVFLVAGLFDMFWHTRFGIEVNLEALMSPSHLLLAIGSVLLLTSPLRSWWAAGGGGPRAVAGIAALALATTVVSVFLGYASAFTYINPYPPAQDEPATIGFLLAGQAVAGYVITIAMLTVALLLVHRRRATPGAATTLVALVSLFPVVAREFPRPQTAGMVAAIVAATFVDMILIRLDKVRGARAPWRLPIAGTVFAALVTSAHLLAVHLDLGLHWPVELWTGTIVSTTLIAALLGGFATPPVRTDSVTESS